MDIFDVALAWQFAETCKLSDCSHCSAAASCQPVCGLYRHQYHSAL